MRGRVLVAAVAVVAVAGCGGEPQAERAARDETTASTATKQPSQAQSSGTPSREGKNDEDASRGETGERQSSNEPAVLAYRKLVAALDVMTASGGRQTEQLSKVAGGTMLRDALNQAKAYRKLKIHSTGQTRILWARTVDLTGDQAKKQATVRACYDTSRSRPVDAKGKSAVKPGAPTRWQDDVEMRLDGRTWKANSSRSRATAC